MGHIHLGVLPRTRLWNQVVSLLESGAPVGDVAAVSAHAAETSLLNASADAVFVETVRLLVNIPLAARKADFGDALRRLNLQVGSDPSLMEIVTAATARLDGVAAGAFQNNDFGDLAARSLSSALVACIGSSLPSLFGPSSDDVRLSFRKSSYSTGIAALCRAYFSTLVGSSLSYWLDRVLSSNVGAGRPFATIGNKADFDHALRQHTMESSRIIQEFSGGWVGKQFHEKGEIGPADARTFGHVCLKKIVEELRVRRGEDA